MHEKTQQLIAESVAAWRSYATGLADGYAQHLDAIRLMDQVSLSTDETVFNVLNSIDASLASGLLAAKGQCEKSHAALVSAFESQTDPDALREIIVHERDESCDFIRQQTLPQLTRMRESRQLNALIEIMLERFSALANELPERYRILDEKRLEQIEDYGRKPPEPSTKSVPMRSIARSWLETKIARDLGEVNRMMFEQVDGSIRIVTEASQIISFNLRVAANECERVGQQSQASIDLSHAQELALNGLQMAVGRLDSALERLAQLKEQVYEQIISRVDVRMREVEAVAFQQAGAEEQAALRQKLMLARATHFLDQSRKKVADGWRYLHQRFAPLSREVVRDLKSTLGLQRFTPSEVLSIYDQAKLDQESLGRLPFIYRKLYDISPLESADLLVAREEEMSLIETARDRWQQGMPCAVAVIGELGSGKTSLINAAIDQTLKGFRVYSKRFAQTATDESLLARELARMLRLPRVKTLDELQPRLLELGQRAVIVLEDAHQLYQREVGGFATLRKLLLLIARTSHQVFWVVSMRKYTWNYLNMVLRIADSFTFVVNTENLDSHELAQVILARHRVSGFGLRFTPDEVMQQRRKYRQSDDDEQQSMLRHTYFESLGRASEGNILAAIFYWLKSLSELRGNELIVNPLKPLRFDFLREMPIAHLITLSLIIQHGNLTAAEHARILRTDVDASLAVLSHLTNINLLTSEMNDKGEGRFAVSRVIYIPLTKELKAANVLPKDQ